MATSLTPEMPSSPASVIKQAAAKYESDGFCLAWPVLSDDLITRTVPRMEAVARGEYETGQAPLDAGSPNDPPTKLRKIDQPQIADRTILEAITSPELGQAVAAIMDATFVQIWAVQLLLKPPGGDTKGAVGWHQDYFYWRTWWTPESEVFTAWLALSDVREESGPMHFVPGSQRWGLSEASNFWQAHDETKISLPAGETWREESALLPKGAFSLHHRLTFHGSQPNVSASTRFSFALHLRTEKSTPIPRAKLDSSYDYIGHLDDPVACPVIYQR